MVTRAARDGDAVSVAILAEVGHWLGVGIGGLVNILDPEIVAGRGWCRRGRRPGARARESVVSRHGRGRGDAPRRSHRHGRARQPHGCGGRGGAGPGAARVKLGVSLPVFTADPATAARFAARAEELGFDGVFSPDHFFPPVFYPPAGRSPRARGRSRPCRPPRRSTPPSRRDAGRAGHLARAPGSWPSRRRRSII